MLAALFRALTSQLTVFLRWPWLCFFTFLNFFLFNFYCFPCLFANLQNSADCRGSPSPWGERSLELWQSNSEVDVGLWGCPGQLGVLWEALHRLRGLGNCRVSVSLCLWWNWMESSH